MRHALATAQSPRVQPPLRGFTLIEMLITVVVLGILSAVVYPSFMDSVRKGRRSEAMAGVNAVQQAQERFRANRTSYSSSITDAAPTGLALSETTSSGLYTLALSDVTDSGYTVTATAVSGRSQADDTHCVRMVIRALSGNLTTGSGAASGAIDYTDARRCWSR